PASQKLANVTITSAGKDLAPEWHSGKADTVCMYQSPVSNKTYAYVLSSNGEMEQLELLENSGKIDTKVVRGGKGTAVWDVVDATTTTPGSTPTVGGCVVDDETKTLYVSAKYQGIWKFGAEPTDLKTATLIDHPGTDGHLLPRTGGLAIVKSGTGAGYLVASSFDSPTVTDPLLNDRFMVYDRMTNAFIRSFKVMAGAADECTQTDGIDAAVGNFGSGFTAGMFICQDQHNRVTAAPDGAQNYKMVALDQIVDMAAPVASTTTTLPAVTTPTTAPVQVQTPNRSGYWMVGNDGKVYNFGEAKPYGDATLAAGAQAVDLEPTPSGNGYWIIDDLGHVFAKGDAITLSDVDRTILTAAETVSSLSSTKTGKGYWVFTSAGRAIPFGDAVFMGDMSKVKLNGPVLDSIVTASGNGYYMVGSDGGIFSFGDADYKGSMGGQKLNKPVQSLVPDADGVGYWLVASDGGIFAFEAQFRGSMGAIKLNKPVTGMVRYGNGYLMVGEDGGIFSFSDKKFVGSLGDNPPAHPITSVAVLDAPAAQS
ncbi:MAG TPA: phytase, partial [Acidimicrobiia bacterium]|nr:phytase [Acidimicrobiia bacterium]